MMARRISPSPEKLTVLSPTRPTGLAKARDEALGLLIR